MKIAKKLGVVLVTGMVAGGLSVTPLYAATTAVASPVKTASPSRSPVSLSFVQMSRMATLYPKNNQPGDYSLVLTFVTPVTTYFSDRPHRVVGQIDNNAFLNEWATGKNSFASDAPNAVLTGAVRDYFHFRTMKFVFALSNPSYDANQGTMTYDAHLLPGGNKLPTTPVRVKYSALFIDNACISCVG